MTDPTASDPVVQSQADDDKLMPIVVYILYILGWASGGAAALVGFVMAYVLRGQAPAWARTHYVFLIRTAWMGIIGWVAVGLLFLLGIPLTLILVGFLMWKFAAGLAVLIGVWVTVRCIVGLTYASRREPYPRPRAWFV